MIGSTAISGPTRRRILVFFLAFVVVMTVGVGDVTERRWIAFNDSSGETPYQIHVTSQRDTEIIVEAKFNGMFTFNRVVNGETFQVLRIEHCDLTRHIGMPELPECWRYIEVPEKGKFTAELLDATCRTLADYNVYPRQQQPIDLISAPEPEFYRNNEFYTQDTFHPDSSVEIEGPYVMRGQRLILVKIHPVMFNPDKQALKVCSVITVKIRPL
jgi:hypothetical protein